MPRAYEEFYQCCYWWHLPLLTKCWDFPSLVFFPPPLSIPFCLFAFALFSAILFIFHHLCSLFFDFYLNEASLLSSLFGSLRCTGKFHPLDFNCHLYAGISQLCVPALTFWGIFLTPTTNSVIIQIPSGYPTIQFNSGTNDPQLDPIS